MTKEEFCKKHGGSSRYEKFVIAQELDRVLGAMQIEKESLICTGAIKDMERSFNKRPYVITYDETGKFVRSVYFGEKDD